MTCQWITEEPTADDSCKCGKPTVDGTYCQRHLDMAFIKTERQAPTLPAPKPDHPGFLL